MTSGAKSSRLKVPGATLYDEVQGSGPVLIRIPGGPTDAGVFAGLAAHLADRYSVAACDPRGNSRSVLEGAREEQRLDVHGDDMARLIEALGDEPAFVFGSSGGAQIGLNLAVRHPERVRALVAHEPPCLKMLPDSSQALAGNGRSPTPTAAAASRQRCRSSQRSRDSRAARSARTRLRRRRRFRRRSRASRATSTTSSPAASRRSASTSPMSPRCARGRGAWS